MKGQAGWLLASVLGCAFAVVVSCGKDAGPQPGAEATEKPREAVTRQAGEPVVLGTAAITGKVRYDGKVPNLRPIQMDADPGCQAKHSSPVKPETLVLGDQNAMANVFIYVKSGLSGRSYPVPEEPVVLDQQGCRYVPHVMGVRVGQPLKILNSDGLLHNVHALPEINASFNRAMPANVTEAEHRFTKEESMFKIKCDVHPWMNSYVAVMAHPFFAVTGEDGQYAITGLAAGAYEIEAWHEKLGLKTMRVEVADGETQTADFAFTM